MGDELSRRKAQDYHTHGQTPRHTDAGNNNTQRPKLALGKNPTPLAYIYKAMHIKDKGLIAIEYKR